MRHAADAVRRIRRFAGARGSNAPPFIPRNRSTTFPGYPRIDAAELVDRLAEQAAPFAPRFHLGMRVPGLDAADDGFVVENAGACGSRPRRDHRAGAGAFGRTVRRSPASRLRREQRLLSGAAARGFPRPRVVIAGGGDSAVDWALSLAEVAERVTVVHRRARFRAAPQSAAACSSWPARAGSTGDPLPAARARRQPAAAVGRHRRRSRGQQRGGIEADCLLPFFGLATDLGPLAGWGLDLDRNHIRVDPATCAASRPGVFAVGDIAAYPGKLKLILSGFAEAALAAHAMHPLVHPGQSLHFEYSTRRRASPPAPLCRRADFSSQTGGGSAAAFSAGGSPQSGRQAAGDCRAGAGFGFDRHRAAVQLDQALDQRQTEAGARFAGLRVAALELLEHAFLVHRRNADAGVGYRQDQLVAVAARLQPDRAAGRGEFDRVRDQVEQRLFQPPLVGLDRADIARDSAASGRGRGCGRAPGSGSSLPAASRGHRSARFPAPCIRPRSSPGRGCR
jgi:thioredoxin reductase (NADPH)